ncbi:heme oxygenase (biliverdin-producing, ferredoxin) [Thermostichus sp. MS-CIW-39]
MSQSQNNQNKKSDLYNRDHSLSAQLREGTKQSHTMAENMAFIKCFLKGVVDKRAYSRYVGNFYFVYSALEEGFAQLREHPLVGRLYYPELWRKASLEKDLNYFVGPNWRSLVKPSPACQVYVNRIREVVEKDPLLLIAHAYTRYIGDLSGGQILKNIARRAMGLPPGEGTAFYDFEQIPHEGKFKQRYRAQLDALELDQTTIDRIVAEANYAFKLNMDLFRELEGNWLLSMARLAWNSLLSQFQRKPTRSEAAAPSS